jgi:uncharacterized protein (DUF885 family)
MPAVSTLTTWFAYCAIALLTGCATVVRREPPADDVARVTALADDYVREYFETYPEQATLSDVAAPRHDDRFSDNSLVAVQRWRAKEDVWLAQVRTVDRARLVGHPEWVTYGALREQLEVSVATRVCREELWFVRHDSGWLDMMVAEVVAAQPVGSHDARTRALLRWKDLGRFIDVEIANLKEGIRLGYSTPKGNVGRVVRMTDDLLNKPIEETFLFDPAKRANDAAFAKALADVIRSDVQPALRRYRDYLQVEYMPHARDAVSVAAIPNGPGCYRAFVRRGTSLDLHPDQVHRTGLEQMDLIEAEERVIAERSYHTTDLPALNARITTDKEFLVAGGDEKVRLTREAVKRANDVVPRVFGLRPKTDVEVRPFDFEAAPHYQQSPEAGRPGIFWTTHGDAEPRVTVETTAFHEAIPGHHWQIAIGLERGKILHPIARYFWVNAFGEGWALYAERLADELGLFSDDLSRFGMLSEQAFRAARLVVDTGIHAKGWSRQRAIDYMLTHTAASREEVESEIDRYIGCPGQALGYMIGELEIMRLRKEAQAKLGARFDLTQFHDRVLEDGNINLVMLRTKIERWIASSP